MDVYSDLKVGKATLSQKSVGGTTLQLLVVNVDNKLKNHSCDTSVIKLVFSHTISLVPLVY